MASHTINTRSLAALVAITQNVFLARSLRAPICGHVTTAECRYTLALQALCSIEFLAHATFTCTGSTFSNLHKNFLSRTRSDPHQVQPAHKRISLRVHASQFRVPATRQRTLIFFELLFFHTKPLTSFVRLEGTCKHAMAITCVCIIFFSRRFCWMYGLREPQSPFSFTSRKQGFVTYVFIVNIWPAVDILATFQLRIYTLLEPIRNTKNLRYKSHSNDSE